MFERRSLKLPITLGVVMIILLVILTIGWVLLSVFGAGNNKPSAAFYWTLLPLGSTFLVLTLSGVITYLTLSIKAVNLSRRQSNFMDSVTHELKSPIASLKLYLQTLTRRQVSDEERENFHRYMLEDIERLDDLINDLLDAAKLDKKPDDSEFEEVPLHELIRHCAETVRLRYRVSPETIQLKLQKCTVNARRVDLDIIFRNLIDNALKYADEKPHVEITLKVSQQGETITTIQDNGHGIPAQLRRKIFGRFVRLGLELERKKPGTGLGLYIVRTLVSRLRGRIRVHGVEQGTGTVFEVRLPGNMLSTKAEAVTSETIEHQEEEAVSKDISQ